MRQQRVSPFPAAASCLPRAGHCNYASKIPSNRLPPAAPAASAALLPAPAAQLPSLGDAAAGSGEGDPPGLRGPSASPEGHRTRSEGAEAAPARRPPPHATAAPPRAYRGRRELFRPARPAGLSARLPPHLHGVGEVELLGSARELLPGLVVRHGGAGPGRADRRAPPLLPPPARWR